MPEFWLDVYPVGFHKVFLAGKVPGTDDFEIELTPTQIEMLYAFQNVQREQEQEFLLGLVT